MCLWIVASQDIALISACTSALMNKSMSLCSKVSPIGNSENDCNPRGPYNVMKN